jgi:hypothetical protein
MLAIVEQQHEPLRAERASHALRSHRPSGKIEPERQRERDRNEIGI